MDENERRRIRIRTSNFEITSGKMYYLGGKNSKKGDRKLVITSDQKLSILKLCHVESGSHLGMEKTFYKLAERYYWNTGRECLWTLKSSSNIVISASVPIRNQKPHQQSYNQWKCQMSHGKKMLLTSLDPIMIQKENRSLKMDSDMC